MNFWSVQLHRENEIGFEKDWHLCGRGDRAQRYLKKRYATSSRLPAMDRNENVSRPLRQDQLNQDRVRIHK
jgi:hypothetical protein